MVQPLPDYKDLDLSGEALQAALRMEARSREAASAIMFQELVSPFLTQETKTVLEFGCGTAALSRRIAKAIPQAIVIGSDKSEGMLKFAQSLVEAESINNIQLVPWDVTDETTFPFQVDKFNLIISSVVIPYLDDRQTISLIDRLSSYLAPGGILTFVEQDLASDSISFPKDEILRKILQKDSRKLKCTLGLGLRPILRKAGLQVLPRRSFLWTDDMYGDYVRDLLERFAEAACDRGDINSAERDEWKNTLNDLAQAGDFYYGLVYHLVAGKHESA